ncbi:MAG: hypothetical protein ACE5HV_00185 [Acidobacteriota bacterium]
MPGYSGNVDAFTPSLTDDNYTLEGDTSGDLAKVRMVNWGGELVASTAYRTRWVRPTTAGVGAGTAGSVEAHNPRFAAPLTSFFTTYATTQPVLPATPDALFLTAWNAHGGLGILVLPPGMEWEVAFGLLTASLSCRNLVGVDANGSTYGIGWEE